MVRAVKQLLENSTARRRLRRAAQDMTWAHHTWEDTVAKLVFWHRLFSTHRLHSASTASPLMGTSSGGSWLLPSSGGAAGGWIGRVDVALNVSLRLGRALGAGSEEGGAAGVSSGVCSNDAHDKARYHAEIGWKLILASRDYDAQVHLAVALDLCPAAAGRSVTLPHVLGCTLLRVDLVRDARAPS